MIYGRMRYFLVAVAVGAHAMWAQIVCPLTPQPAAISGKVMDQNGDPVSGAEVRLVVGTWQQGKRRYVPEVAASTDERGEYRFSEVHPWKFYLMAQRLRFMSSNEIVTEPGKADIRPVRTFYPDALSIQDAVPVVVKAGQDLKGIDIRLRSAATYHIRGQIIGTVSESTNGELSVAVYNRDEQDDTSLADATVTKIKSFDIAGIAPGSYALNLSSMDRTLGHQDVEIGSGDVNNVQITIAPPFTVHGEVQIEGRPQPSSPVRAVKGVDIHLMSADSLMAAFEGAPTGTAGDDGTFDIRNVVPDNYYLAYGLIPGAYLKSVLLGGQESRGKALDLSQGSGQLNVIFSYGAAEVYGRVQMPANSPMSAGFVALVADTLAEDGSSIESYTVKPDGSFTVKQLPPGHYRAYAFERLDYGQLQNPDVLKQLESKGTEVELKENDRKQIQLPLITEDDMQQIYSRLGIEVPQE